MYFSEQVQVGSLKITRNALFTLSSGIVLSAIIMFAVPKVGVWIGLVTLLMFVLAAYNINCAVVGKCTTWALILTILYLISTIGAIIKYFTDSKGFVKKFSK